MSSIIKTYQKWYFTFGFGQEHENCFTVIEGTYEEARDKMFKIYGDKWAFQYSEKQWFNEQGVSQQMEYNLTEIKT